MISWDVIIMDSDLHAVDSKKIIHKPIRIENNVWIGCRSIILKGITIGEGAIIGAGSIVSKDVPSGAIVGGNPAQILSYRHNIKLTEKNLV